MTNNCHLLTQRPIMPSNPSITKTTSNDDDSLMEENKNIVYLINTMSKENGQELVPIASKNEMKRTKHRLTERNRHNQILLLFKELGATLGMKNSPKTQVSMMDSAARYLLYLTSIESMLQQKLMSDQACDQTINRSIDLSQLHAFYNDASEKVERFKYGMNIGSNILVEVNDLETEVSIKRERIMMEIGNGILSGNIIAGSGSEWKCEIKTPSREMSMRKWINGIERSPENDHCLPLKKRCRMFESSS